MAWPQSQRQKSRGGRCLGNRTAGHGTKIKVGPGQYLTWGPAGYGSQKADFQVHGRGYSFQEWPVGGQKVINVSSQRCSLLTEPNKLPNRKKNQLDF